ncbi:multidrug resistance-associated protein 1 [Thecamonas trahens ATCC 50062]|uniref:Multidrug resistance-associated protein 1 n=1 Tax=Thecamonas trahens ATCC 50062 TaxID=461836 RepID=A0A0L0DHQ8_THETB|nr:multidrug resistance-associated protein 1 [Thecamonas trahens ATCC 50062]KNC51636.1 multidrug resistance-associated protein 1 [Thecamonas trahens ATCC 50062]|eukprot:XP_013756030.1 multidrug resistance-associated protein 1 [Thecamonas trahens ATCC 50062]
MSVTEAQASWWQTLTLRFFNPLLHLGAKRALELEDLAPLREEMRTGSVVARLDESWAGEVPAGQFEHAPTPRKSLLRALVDEAKVPLSRAGLLGLVYGFVPFLGPLFLWLLIQNLKEDSPSVWIGFGLALAMGLSTLTMAVSSNHAFRLGLHGAVTIHAAVLGLIYNKALVLSNTTRQSHSVGAIVNMIAVDATYIFEFVIRGTDVLVLPLQLILALVLLFILLGPSALVGLAVILLAIPTMGFISKAIKKHILTKLVRGDTRLKITKDAIQGIRAIKAHAWEDAFTGKIQELRAAELDALQSFYLVQSGLVVVIAVLTPIIALTTFSTYAGAGNALTAETVFAALAIFQLIALPIVRFPMLASRAVSMYVAVGRIDAFLRLPERIPLDRASDRQLVVMASPSGRPSYESRDAPPSAPAVRIVDGDFAWEERKASAEPAEAKIVSADVESVASASESPTTTLSGINLTVPHGSLTVVVGPVGCGKSSLLAAMLANISIVTGSVAVTGRLAYVAQQPWIANATLRDNIVFGLEFDAVRYDAAVAAAALRPDLDVLAAGDLTEIGERGVNLSGGQRARVALARAIYRDADVYLLDDILSAVDAHTGVAIFRDCIVGSLRTRTRVLVTHQLSLLRHADQVVFMGDDKLGTIAAVGSFDELMAQNPAFADMIASHATQAGSESPAAAAASMLSLDWGSSWSESLCDGGVGHAKARARAESSIDMPPPATTAVYSDYEYYSESEGGYTDEISSTAESESWQGGVGKVMRAKATASTTAFYSLDDDAEAGPAPSPAAGTKLMTDEDRVEGAVSSAVYKEFFSFISRGHLAIIIGLFVVSLALLMSSSVWLAHWTQEDTARARRGESDRRIGYYVAVYVSILVGALVLTILRETAFVKAMMATALALHARLVDNVLHLTVRFYDTTPVGRVINRFSKDVGVADTKVLMMLRFGIMLTVGLSGYLAMASVLTFGALPVVMVPVVWGMKRVFGLYRSSGRDLQRIESITNSPMLAHFSESYTGAAELHAFERLEHFSTINTQLVDNHHRAYYTNKLATRWLDLRLAGVSAGLVATTVALVVVLRPLLSPSFAGLAVQSMLALSGELSLIIMIAAELETAMTSVERILTYVHLVDAEDVDAAEVEVPDGWPAADGPATDAPAAIAFDNVSMRYRDGLELALRKVSFSIPRGARVGVVGRSGSGKSSLVQALLRFIPLAGGRIMVDGLDTAQVSLRALRHNVFLIPQAPVLFEDSIRANLDPLGVCDEARLWKVLEQTRMAEAVRKLPDGLETAVAAGGGNFSVGERQLLCIGRALIAEVGILLLDEATASIDAESDAVMQSMLRDHFAVSGCTVFTIAHRLNTLDDSDYVLVMDQGTVGEFGPPAELKARKNGLYRGLLDEWAAQKKNA